jgi:hypothetical protein
MSSVNLVLTAFESTQQLTSSATVPQQTSTFTSDATITLTTDVSAADLQNTFFFRSDDPILSDASFVYYYVDSSKWVGFNNTLNPKNGTVTTNEYVLNDAIGKDFIRHLAAGLFGTYLGADLFTNEDAVNADINTKCDEIATNISDKISALDLSSGDFGGLIDDVSGKKYLPDNTSEENLGREMFNQLITADPSRFVGINDLTTGYTYNGVDDGFYKMPIVAGDSITFKVILQPDISQNTTILTGGTATERAYKVTLNVV